MLAKRVIPCLDVHDGKVTRGVQFGKAEAGELRNVGDPVDWPSATTSKAPMKWSSSTSPPAPTGAPP